MPIAIGDRFIVRVTDAAPYGATVATLNNSRGAPVANYLAGYGYRVTEMNRAAVERMLADGAIEMTVGDSGGIAVAPIAVLRTKAGPKVGGQLSVKRKSKEP
jgi:hypothetical protein